MPLFETESLVLRSYNLAEADRIIVFFTKEHGVIRGVAKGVKRLKSKFGSMLEPFSIVDLEYFQKEDRELVSIQNVELVRSAFAAASDPARLNTYSYIADLLLAFAPPHDPNETLYRMVKACIDIEAEDDGDHDAVKLYFEIWMLRLAGYLPEWTHCSRCKRVFTDIESAYLTTGFHLTCGTCHRTNADQMLSPLHRTVFHNVQKLAPPAFLELAQGHTDAVKEISAIMKRIISGALGKDVSMAETRP